jgi:hypothetical protein
VERILKSIKKQLWMFFSLMILVSMSTVPMVTVIHVTSASPETYFWVNPPEVKNLAVNDYFPINISIADAPASFAWELFLSWNPALMEYIDYSEEGNFLNRGGLYTTTYTVYSSAGNIAITCSLSGDAPWASGNGWLCTLWFQVKALGNCILNLSETRLWDYWLLGAPAHTYYSNRDGFFYNQPYHDIALTSVTAQPTTVYTGVSTSIGVTIKNEGNFTETSGTFNVTVYADKTPYEYLYDALGRLIRTNIVVGDEITVGTKSVTSPLAIGASTTLTFTWNTAGAEPNATYTISALVRGDSDTRDNLYIDAKVYVKMRGDVNSDGKVNVPDLFALGKAYGSTEGPPASPNWNPACDFNGDHKVDVSDLSDLKANYGKIAGT